MSTSVTSTSNLNRINGMVSGFDTDALIKQALAADTAKIEKVKANIQIDKWKTDSYREITSKLQSFYSTYFDPISPTRLTSANSFTSFATSYGATTSANYVTVTGGTSAEAGTYTITNLTTAKAAKVAGSDVSKTVESSAEITNLVACANTKLSITLNGTTKDITLGSSTDLAGLVNDLNTKLDAAFGADRIVVDLNSTSNGIKFTTSDTDTFSIGSSGTANSALGLTNSNLSNKIDLTAKLSTLTNSLGSTLTTGAGNTIAFTINGTSFSFNSTTTSMQDIMDAVNANTKINATMKYDTTTNSFSVKSSGTGVTEEVKVADTTGNLMATLFGINLSAKGTDASVTVKEGTTTKTIARSSNSFTYDGLTYNIKQDFTSDIDSTTSTPDPIVATVSTDTTKTYDYIKGFVDKYNELIEKVNTKLNEKTYSDYVPLTDDQKADMTEDQITKWEDKAKSGLLKNDSTLSGIVSKLRSILYDTVEGAGITLASIGITTSSDYLERGKLEINETTLKNALANKPEQVTKLFTNSSDKSYYETLNSSTIKDERYKESGIAQRFSDIIQDAIRTTTDNDGNKGSLLMKAGILGDRSEYSNILFKEMEDFNTTITEMNDRLSDKQDALYAKYTAMESALSKMNSQSTWLSQQFGGGS